MAWLRPGTRRPSALRAWMIAHDAAPVAGVLAALALGLALGSDSLMPIPGSVAPLPVWQMAPALFSLPLALATVCRLPERGVWARSARAGWAAALIGGVWTGATVVDAAAGLPAIAPAAVVIAALTIGASSVLGRAAVCVPTAPLIYLVTHVREFASTQNPWAVPPVWGGVAGCSAAAGLASYALLGGGVGLHRGG